MGIERARVVEVYAGDGAGGRAGSGYQVDGRLVLTAAGVVGRSRAAEVRPAGGGGWVPASVVWRGGAAVLSVSDPSALMPSPAPVRWGEVAGARPVPVTGMGFLSTAGRPQWARDPRQFVGHLSADGSLPASAAVGMAGAAVFAGAELVGVLDDGGRAVPVASLAADAAFVGVVGELTLVRVETPATGFPMLR